MRSILRSFEPTANRETRAYQTGSSQDNGAKIFNSEQTIRASMFDRGLDTDSELSKLLNCNYSGISNLYWCDNGN